MKSLTENIKKELLLFVLERTPVYHFNNSIKAFSVQMLYSRYRSELMKNYPNLMPSVLHYSVIMCEVFKPFQCDEIECPKLLQKIDALKKLLPTYKRMNIDRWAQKVKEHDVLVAEYLKKLEPQNKLIKEYKKVLKNKKP